MSKHCLFFHNLNIHFLDFLIITVCKWSNKHGSYSFNFPGDCQFKEMKFGTKQKKMYTEKFLFNFILSLFPFFLKSTSTQKHVFLLVSTVVCLNLFDNKRLFAHSFAKNIKFVCAH